MCEGMFVFALRCWVMRPPPATHTHTHTHTLSLSLTAPHTPPQIHTHNTTTTPQHTHTLTHTHTGPRHRPRRPRKTRLLLPLLLLHHHAQEGERRRRRRRRTRRRRGGGHDGACFRRAEPVAGCPCLCRAGGGDAGMRVGDCACGSGEVGGMGGVEGGWRPAGTRPRTTHTHTHTHTHDTHTHTHTHDTHTTHSQPTKPKKTQGPDPDALLAAQAQYLRRVLLVDWLLVWLAALLKGQSVTQSVTHSVSLHDQINICMCRCSACVCACTCVGRWVGGCGCWSTRLSPNQPHITTSTHDQQQLNKRNPDPSIHTPTYAHIPNQPKPPPTGSHPRSQPLRGWGPLLEKEGLETMRRLRALHQSALMEVGGWVGVWR
jgi:hypothetical protein